MDRLARANSRIAQLERERRGLELEKEQLERERRGLEIERDELARALREGGHHTPLLSDEERYFALRIDLAARNLDVAQRRDAWVNGLHRCGLDGPIFGLHPHDGGQDPITILVVGSGGFGDMIYLASVVRRLHERFAPARIVVMHEHAQAELVFGSNPYVHAILKLQGDAKERFLALASALDIFDLIADVRYVVTYATPPLSRVPAEFLIPAHSRASQWQKYARRDWPLLNNLFAKEAVKLGMSKYDLVGYTGNLPIDSELAGDFFPTQELGADVAAKLKGKTYVTVHHGSDRHMAALGGRQTKNLPDATWGAIVASLQAEGFIVAQVGEAHENLIENVDVDLRGETSFAQTALVVKHGQVHADTEGGIVHLARSMGQKSVVMFGPTSVEFFGYKPNVNLAPKLCGDCWWITPEWAKSCVRGLRTPECMDSHEPAEVVAQIVRLASWSKLVSFERASAIAGGDERRALSGVAEWLSGQPRGETSAFVLQSEALLSQIAGAPQERRSSLDVFVSSRVWSGLAARVESVLLRPALPAHIPADSGVYEFVFVDLSGLCAADAERLLAEGARLLRDGGRLLFYSGFGPDRLQALSRALQFEGATLGGWLKADRTCAALADHATLTPQFVGSLRVAAQWRRAPVSSHARPSIFDRARAIARTLQSRRPHPEEPAKRRLEGWSGAEPREIHGAASFETAPAAPPQDEDSDH
ncbi:MAG TPA: glycosyltransferase family 9 protein [Methylocystis sp.]|nr:glycosyltransferase family 9 protein [Methylocystis sp.]